eukprot:1495993-Pleurochrysis_carterae.AAC.1
MAVRRSFYYIATWSPAIVDCLAHPGFDGCGNIPGTDLLRSSILRCHWPHLALRLIKRGEAW